MLSYIKLLRPVNLLIIALTQYLVLFFIIKPFMSAAYCQLQMSHLDFALFVFSNVLLAAAGYAINDYFDTDVDEKNKAGKNVLVKKIKRKHAYLMNIIMNTIACIIGFYCAYKVGYIMLGFFYVVIALALYYYSLRYKRQFLTGNIVVALLAAYSVLSVWLFQFFAVLFSARTGDPLSFINSADARSKITYFVFGLALFALLITLIREIIKDIEDAEGDEACGCNTLAVKKGIPFAKKSVMWLSIFTMLMLAAAQFCLYAAYTTLSMYLCVIQVLLIYLIVKLLSSHQKSEYHFLSIFVKIIMIAGILSTQMLYTYF